MPVPEMDVDLGEMRARPKRLLVNRRPGVKAALAPFYEFPQLDPRMKRVANGDPEPANLARAASLDRTGRGEKRERERERERERIRDESEIKAPGPTAAESTGEGTQGTGYPGVRIHNERECLVRPYPEHVVLDRALR